MEIKKESEDESWSQLEPQAQSVSDMQNIKAEPEGLQYQDDKSTMNLDAACSLYYDHTIKEEIVFGPTVFYKPNIDYPRKFVLASPENPPSESNESNKENYSTSCYSALESSNDFKTKIKDLRINIENNLQKKSLKKAKFSCDYCKKTFNRKKHIIKHIQEHIEIIGYVCTICKKRYDNKVQFEKHVTSHSAHRDKKSDLTCEICSKCFTFKSNLCRHVKEFHSGDKKVYKCKKCKATFEKRSNFYSHKCDTSSCSSYVCVCGRKYIDKSNYNRHIKGYCDILSKVDSVNCPKCNKIFQNKTRLGIHIRRHNRCNEKTAKYICDFCDKKYQDKRGLIHHLSQHMNLPKLYVCEICNKNFCRPYSLKKHLISHTGKRLFKCSKCEITLRSREGWKTHEKRCSFTSRPLYETNNENELTCKICQKKLSMISFAKHWKKRHEKCIESKKLILLGKITDSSA